MGGDVGRRHMRNATSAFSSTWTLARVSTQERHYFDRRQIHVDTFRPGAG